MILHGRVTCLRKKDSFTLLSGSFKYLKCITTSLPNFITFFRLSTEQWQRDAEPGDVPAISGPSFPFIRVVLGSRSSDRLHKGVLNTAFTFFSNSTIFYYATKSKSYH